MPSLPRRKVGIVACSGEELAEGTVTRLAALKVLQELRPHGTVTICLPLFLAGGEGDRAFARLHPTITVDGCGLRCAARGTENYSGQPAASIVVSELLASGGLARPSGRRRLDAAGEQAVELTVQHLVRLVDDVVGRTGASAGEAPVSPEVPVGTCSCGSGVPVSKLVIGGEPVKLLALPLIFRQFREEGRPPDEATARDLLESIRIYNAVPRGAEVRWREEILRAYAAHCKSEARR
jgi:uncharacterized metal-binding protein